MISNVNHLHVYSDVTNSLSLGSGIMSDFLIFVLFTYPSSLPKLFCFYKKNAPEIFSTTWTLIAMFPFVAIRLVISKVPFFYSLIHCVLVPKAIHECIPLFCPPHLYNG